MAESLAESLEDRFKRFMTITPNSEVIDELGILDEFKKRKRADYLCFDRRVIIELKSIATDSSYKVDTEMKKHRDREDYPLFYGGVELKKVLAHLPDGQRIMRQIFHNVTRSIKDFVNDANKQIGDTKLIFDIKECVGLVVVLNQGIDILTPDVVIRRMSESLSNKQPNGEPQIQNIDFIWYIDETHSVKFQNGYQAFASILLQGPNADTKKWFDPLFQSLQQSWARFNNAPIITPQDDSSFDLERFNQIKQHRQSGPNITRHDLLIQQYNKNPYLRKLNEQDLLHYGTKIFKDLTPYFLKGGPRIPLNQLEPLIIKWSDFLEEARYRGLDLKQLSPRTH